MNVFQIERCCPENDVVDGTHVGTVELDILFENERDAFGFMSNNASRKPSLWAAVGSSRSFLLLYAREEVLRLADSVAAVVG